MSAAQVSRDWLDYAAALTPSLIAVFIAYIAYRQWRTAREKLRLDLYAKRFAIFDATLRFYQLLLGGATQDEEQVELLHRQFITAMIESRFLFAQEAKIKDLLSDFNKSAFTIKGNWGTLRARGMPPESLGSIAHQVSEEQASLGKKLEAIEVAMAPYLQFRGQVD